MSAERKEQMQKNAEEKSALKSDDLPPFCSQQDKSSAGNTAGDSRFDNSEGCRTPLSLLKIVEESSDLRQKVQLDGNARYFSSNRLLPALEAITPALRDLDGKSESEQAIARAELIKSRQESLRKEYDSDNPWGPAHQEAMKDYLNFMQTRLQDLLRGFASFGVPLPEGNELKVLRVPLANGSQASSANYAELVLKDRLRLSPEDIGRPPSSKEYWQMERQNKWLSESEKKLNELFAREQDRQVDKVIVERNLPEKWLSKHAFDLREWRRTAPPLVGLLTDLSQKVSYARALSIPIDDVFMAEADKASSQNFVSLPGPRSLDLSDPVNILKIKELERAQLKLAEKLALPLEQQEKASMNQFAAIVWGDRHIAAFKDEDGNYKSGIALFDENNTLVSIENPHKFKPKEGQTSAELNMLEARAQAETLEDGRIKVRVSFQAQYVPWYMPQDIRIPKLENWFGARNLGKAHTMEFGPYKPEQLVLLSDESGNPEPVAAKDLQAHFDLKQALHWGEKIGMIAMSYGMTTKAIIETTAAVRGLFLASSKLSTKQLMGHGAKGAFEFALGASEPAGNAYWTAYESGRDAAQLRGTLFLATIAHGLGKTVKEGGSQALNQASNYSRRKLGLPEQEASSKAMTKQLSAMHFDELITSLGNPAQKSRQLAFKVMSATDIPMGLTIGKDLNEQFGRHNKQSADFYRNRSVGEVSKSMLKENSQEKTGGDFEKSPQSVSKRLEIYSHFFAQPLETAAGEGRNENKASEIGMLFKRAASALQNTENSQALKVIVSELANNLSFSEKELSQLQLVNEAALSSELVASLINAQKRLESPAPLRLAVEQIMNSKNKSFLAANKVLLLEILTCREDLAQAETRKTLRYLAPHLQANGKGLVFSQDLSIKFDKNFLLESLKQDLPALASDGRGLAITDALMRAGVFDSKQFAPALDHVLNNSENSKQAKLRALQLLLNLPENSLANDSARESLNKVLKKTASAQGADLDRDLRDLAGELYLFLNSSSGGNDATAKSIDRRIASVEVQGFLSAGLPEGKAALASETNKRIFADAQEILNSASIAQGNRLLQSLKDSAFAFLSSNDIEDAAKVLHKAVALISTPLKREWKTTEKEMSNYISIVAALIDKTCSISPEAGSQSRSSQALLQTFVAAAERSLQDLPASYKDLRSSLLASVAKLPVDKDQKWRVISKEAKNQESAVIRAAALRAIADLQERFPTADILALFQNEDDPGILESLSKYRSGSYAEKPLDQSSPEAAIEALQEELNIHYPELKEFSGEEEKLWVDRNFPLLQKESFIEELKKLALKDRYGSSLSFDLQKEAERLSAQREKQFQRLQNLASMSILNPATARARVLLYSIAAGDEKYNLESASIKLGAKKQFAFDELSMLRQNLRQDTDTTQSYYRHRAKDWRNAAHEALRASSREGNSGRNLSHILQEMLKLKK